MARTAAVLLSGARISDHVTLGVLTSTVPAQLIDAVLADTGRQSRRQRQLPARLVVYYVMALALYAQASYGEVLRCLLEGVRWLRLGGTAVPDSLLTHTSPVGWEHIGFSGDFLWDRAAVPLQARRPLNRAAERLAA